MDFSAINWLAVLACVVFSVVSGSLWFGPKTFFPVWWKAIGKSDSDKPDGRPMTWILIMVSSFVQAVFMALMVNAMGSMTGGATLVSGMTAGFLLWLGFVAPTSLVNKLFPGYLKAWAIENGNHLINFVVFGAILGAWH
ncbi:MAG: hypothetical protein H6Q04_3216 [Acidobacteria bacterium]|nr:hypothetical protein [Acidobacteriota bacterium]